MFFIKKLLISLFDYICIVPNLIFYGKKTLNTQQDNNKKSIQKNGYFYLNQSILENEKNLIVSIMNSKDVKKIISENKSKKENKHGQIYVIDLLQSNHFTQDEKMKIKNTILSNDQLKSEISRTLGFKSIPSNINLLLNHYNQDSIELEGPKQWHRDNSAAVGQVKIFFALNEIDLITGGQFFFISIDKIQPYKRFVVKNDYDKNKNLWNRYRYKDEEINKFTNIDNDIKVYPSAEISGREILVINTNDCYHKGGYIKKEGSYRLLLQIVFDPAISFSDQKGNFFAKRILTFVRNSLREKVHLN